MHAFVSDFGGKVSKVS